MKHRTSEPKHSPARPAGDAVAPHNSSPPPNFKPSWARPTIRVLPVVTHTASGTQPYTGPNLEDQSGHYVTTS